MPFMWKASNPPWDPWALGGPRLKILRDQTPHPEGPHPRPPARRVRPLPRTTQRSLGINVYVWILLVVLVGYLPANMTEKYLCSIGDASSFMVHVPWLQLGLLTGVQPRQLT